MGRDKMEAKDRSKRTVEKLSKEMRKVGNFLLGVIDGTIVDEFEVTKKDGEVERIRKPATLSVRVSAAKQYKELIIDKILPDTKDDPKKQPTSHKKYMEALNDIEGEIHKTKAMSN